MRSERENYQYYQEQVRHKQYRRVQLQSITQQNSLFELEYLPKGRPSDYLHPRTNYFREEYQLKCQSLFKEFSFHTNNRSSHKSYFRMDSYHYSSPVNGAHTVNKRSSLRSPNEINLPERELYHRRSYNRYQQKRDKTSTHSTRYSSSRNIHVGIIAAVIIQLELLIRSHQQDTLQGTVLPESTGLLIIKELMTKDYINAGHPATII